MQEAPTRDARSWWLANDKQPKEKHPYLWIDSRSPKIVIPGELKLSAGAPSASLEQRGKLAAIAKQPEFTHYCKPGAGGPYSLFTIILPYKEEEPVDYSAKIIADILLALHEVENSMKEI